MLKYKQYNESIKSLLVGPTEKEMLSDLKKLNPTDALFKCISKDLAYIKGVEQSINDGADINKRDNKLDFSPIDYAMWNGYVDIVKLLIEKGATLDTEKYPIDYILKMVINKDSSNDLETLKYFIKNINSYLDIKEAKDLCELALKKQKIEIYDFLSEYISNIEIIIKNYINKI